MRTLTLLAIAFLLLAVSTGLATDTPPPANGALVLTPAIAADAKGDGPDGKSNTGDDTWQFWLMVLHDRNLYIRLDLATKIQPEEIRKNGIKRKVWGPLGSTLPNPKDSEGHIYHSDWDGKREGVWGDAKAKQVLVVPYQEKADGGPLAVTCRIPADGTYVVSGKATDLEVDKKHRMADGARVSVELTVAKDGKTVRRTRGKVLVKPIAFGDQAGPESVEFKSDAVALKKGQLVFLMVDPIKVAYKDMTRIEFHVLAVE